MNRQDLHKIQEQSNYPSLTITLPTHRTAPDNRQDRIRLRNLCKQANDQLLVEFSRREIEPLLKRLENLVQSIRYRHTLDGLVLFVNQEFSAKYYLPFSVPERVLIADNFMTRDLVYAINRTQRYWVLALSEKPTRLYEGTRDILVEVQEGGFPFIHEGPGGEAPLPGGFGIKKSAYRDERHRQFFRMIDNALKPFLAEDPIPVALVGVNRFLAFFNEITDQQDSLLTSLNGSHDKTPPQKLAKLVWPRVEAAFAKKRLQHLAELDRAAGEKKVVSGIADVWRMANEGRGRLLLVEEGFHSSGKLDNTGIDLLPVEDPLEPGVIPDAVDEIIETVLQKQGRVVFAETGQLEDHQRIALIMRY